MPLKKAQGNMYSWVTSTHSHLGGMCPHRCCYCYVQRNPFGVNARYLGQPRLIENEFAVNYGKGKTIFIEHMNDLFANEIPFKWIHDILGHCNRYPDNKFVFQTKNPIRAYDFIDILPRQFMMGTTIESNRYNANFSKAPCPEERYQAIKKFKESNRKTFITVEPIMDFDIEILANWIITAKPDFVNIGADSKNCLLPEPSQEKIQKLIEKIRGNTEIKIKDNLKRIIK